MEKHFGNPVSIDIMLIVYGIAFIAIEVWNKRRAPSVKTIDNISYKTAFIIGLFQVLSMIPGTSHSGATIVGALLLGVSRTTAAEFTFFLAVPSMLAASTFKLLKFGFSFTSSELLVLIMEMAVVFIVSIFVLRKGVVNVKILLKWHISYNLTGVLAVKCLGCLNCYIKP